MAKIVRSTTGKCRIQVNLRLKTIITGFPFSAHEYKIDQKKSTVLCQWVPFVSLLHLNFWRQLALSSSVWWIIHFHDFPIELPQSIVNENAQIQAKIWTSMKEIELRLNTTEHHSNKNHEKNHKTSVITQFP
jgi:hypothetical protein